MKVSNEAACRTRQPPQYLRENFVVPSFCLMPPPALVDNPELVNELREEAEFFLEAMSHFESNDLPILEDDSMLWWVLNLPQYLTITELTLNADNCGGQGKNKFILWFLSWLAIIHPSLQKTELNFCLPGHTKMFCDACFGLVKRAVKKEAVFTPKEMLQLTDQRSSKCNKGVGEGSVMWFDWKEGKRRCDWKDLCQHSQFSCEVTADIWCCS